LIKKLPRKISKYSYDLEKTTTITTTTTTTTTTQLPFLSTLVSADKAKWQVLRIQT